MNDFKTLIGILDTFVIKPFAVFIGILTLFGLLWAAIHGANGAGCYLAHLSGNFYLCPSEQPQGGEGNAFFDFFSAFKLSLNLKSWKAMSFSWYFVILAFSGVIYAAVVATIVNANITSETYFTRAFVIFGKKTARTRYKFNMTAYVIAVGLLSIALSFMYASLILLAGEKNDADSLYSLTLSPVQYVAITVTGCVLTFCAVFGSNFSNYSKAKESEVGGLLFSTFLTVALVSFFSLNYSGTHGFDAKGYYSCGADYLATGKSVADHNWRTKGVYSQQIMACLAPPRNDPSVDRIRLVTITSSREPTLKPCSIGIVDITTTPAGTVLSQRRHLFNEQHQCLAKYSGPMMTADNAKMVLADRPKSAFVAP